MSTFIGSAVLAAGVWFLLFIGWVIHADIEQPDLAFDDLPSCSCGACRRWAEVSALEEAWANS